MIAEKWGVPPWVVTGESLTPWRRFVWIEREIVYLSEVGEKQRREREDFEARING